MQKASTFLMFSGENFGKAEEALKLYTSLFADSEIQEIQYFKEGEQGGKEGTVKTAFFTLCNQNFMALDSLMDHKFNFTPSISVFVDFDEEAELNKIYEKLSEGGSVLMPLDDYGFSKKFGWLQDKYGITWQLNLK